MKLMSIYRNILIAICVLCFPACENQWDDHIEVKNDTEKKTIMQVISSNSETSTFASILKATHYDVFLSGSESVTVFAPTNAALSSIDMEDEEALFSLVKSHIAYMSYPVSEGAFAGSTIEMMNSKRVKTGNEQIGNASLVDYNITTSNGLLHVIDDVIITKQNIWEYLSSKTGNTQIDFIKSLSLKEMDAERSVQTKIDSLTARPIYDTVWVEKNVILEQYPINNEDQEFTFVLLNSTAADRIKTKYLKYFARPTQAQQDSLVEVELFKDCILMPVKILSDGSFESVDGVKMDISAANIQKTYEASNGTVYELADAEVKVYENKLKTFFVEAEDYISTYSDGNAWSKRIRSQARGGYDMMMNSQTRNYYRYSVPDLAVVGGAEKDSTITFTYYYNSNAAAAYGAMGRVSNCYIEFRPVLNSVGYNIFAAAHDDIAWHYDASRTFDCEDWYPMILEQKMLISFPDSSRVSRNEDRKIDNNFSDATTFVLETVAKETSTESQFYRYNMSIADADKGFFIVAADASGKTDAGTKNYYTGSDEYGDKEKLICPRYGESTLLIANTVREKDVNGGLIFLDYIKFVPLVDVND